MQFTAALLSLLPALALAAPAPQAGNSPGSNRCDRSTFNQGADYQIPGAPVADCNALANSLDAWSTFTLGRGWTRPYNNGQCALSARVIAGAPTGLIGGADAKDLLRDSIRNFQISGRVSTRGVYTQVVSTQGEVDCASTQATKVRVEWLIAPSWYNPQN